MNCGDPGGAKCAGTQTASTAGVTALSESFFQPLVAVDQKASLASLSVALPIQALRGLHCLGPSLLSCTSGTWGGGLAGVLLCRLVHQALRGAAWVGSWSVVQCVRSLMCQPLYCTAANAGLSEDQPRSSLPRGISPQMKGPLLEFQKPVHKNTTEISDSAETWYCLHVGRPPWIATDD